MFVPQKHTSWNLVQEERRGSVGHYLRISGNESMMDFLERERKKHSSSSLAAQSLCPRGAAVARDKTA